jgi:LacI family transcriptional regulator
VYTHPLELNGYSGLIDLMDKNSTKQVTAVFAAGDLIAMGALAAARSMQLSVPEELSLIGFDDIDEAAALQPPLTTMHVPIVEIAQSATHILVNMIDRRTPPQHMELPAHLVERATVRPVAVLR